MKRLLVLSIISSFSYAILLAGSPVTISGYVTDTNGHAVDNHYVHALGVYNNTYYWFDDTTNANGYYEGTINFPGNGTPGQAAVWIYNCDQDTIEQTVHWDSSNTAQADFVYCGNYQNNTSCEAYFVYQSGGNGLTIYFDEQSLGDSLSYHWDFGDGTTSSGQNPVHTYQHHGSYLVCLDIWNTSGCQRTYCDTVVVDTVAPDSTFSIMGKFIIGNNFILGGNGHAILYKDSNSTLIPVDTQQVDSINYHFQHVPQGTYYVLGQLDSTSPFFNNYIPTYHDSANYWQSATPITVGPDYIHGDIYLQSATQPTGNGFVSGSVTEGSGKTWGGGDPIPGALVYLRNANDVPILYDRTHKDGTFSFENLAEGFYTLYVEMVNHECDPFAITINAPADSVGNINFQVEDSEVITGLLPFEGVPGITFNISPNPFKEVLQVEIGDELSRDDARLVVMDVNGRLLEEREVQPSTTVELTTRNWVPGLYFIKLVDGGRAWSVKKAIKMK